MKRSSFFLYIRIKVKNKHNIYLLLPLFVVRMIFQGAIFYKLIARKVLNERFKKFKVDIDKVFEAIEILWNSLTAYREEDLVNIVTKDLYVKIKFI